VIVCYVTFFLQRFTCLLYPNASLRLTFIRKMSTNQCSHDHNVEMSVRLRLSLELLNTCPHETQFSNYNHSMYILYLSRLCMFFINLNLIFSMKGTIIIEKVIKNKGRKRSTKKQGKRTAKKQAERDPSDKAQVGRREGTTVQPQQQSARGRCHA
jgi:hypothetical protein